MTDDDKALVERLRSRVSNREILLVDPPRPAPDRDCHYAADRIEALSAENERLKKILRDCDPESISWLDARDAALGETK